MLQLFQARDRPHLQATESYLVEKYMKTRHLKSYFVCSSKLILYERWSIFSSSLGNRKFSFRAMYGLSYFLLSFPLSTTLAPFKKWNFTATPPIRLTDRSVCHNFPKGRTVALPCSYRRSCLFPFSLQFCHYII